MKKESILLITFFIDKITYNRIQKVDAMSLA